MRHRRMTTAAVEADFEIVHRRHLGTTQNADLAFRETRPVMNGKHLFDREALQHPILDHLPAATHHLFRRLKDEDDRAIEISAFGEQLCRTQQNRGVAIMAAGMHDALVLRCIVDIGHFLDRQCIELGAQRDSLAAVSFGQRRNDGGPADIGVHGKAECLEFCSNEGGGFMLGKTEFRIGMDVLAPGNDLWCDFGDAVVGRHG